MGAFIRFLAIGLCLVVAAGFIPFAVDEMDRGSKTQQQALGEGTGVEAPAVAPAPAPADEAAREATNSKAREAIDDANDVVLGPFSGLVNSPSNWVMHGVPALIALLVYGLGLGVLANSLPKTHRVEDWRAAA
jgi:hypothetical protein